jgi:hypothetical protein
MIQDFPWLGCGPGQFQDYYTAYKLPGASEEIQDPHHWFLEVWATIGTPGLLILLALLAAAAWSSVSRSLDRRVAPGEFIERVTKPHLRSLSGMFLGAALGTSVAWLAGFRLATSTIACCLAGATAAYLPFTGWVRTGNVPHFVSLVAAAAMLVNLLGAGSIGYPCLADSLWLLVAIALNESVSSKFNITSRRGAVALCLGLGAAIVAAFLTQYRPVLACRLQLEIADNAMASGQNVLHREAVIAATKADPWSDLAASRFAAQRFADYRQQPHSSIFSLFESANRRALELAPRRAGAWAQSAEYYRSIAEVRDDQSLRDRALTDARRAIDLYPTKAEWHALVAVLESEAGNSAAAQLHARRALELDDHMRTAGHVDRLLDDQSRAEVLRLIPSN